MGAPQERTTQCSARDSSALVRVPEPSALAREYYRSGNVLWAVDNFVGLLIPAVFLYYGFSARLRTLAYRWGRRWLPSLALYGVLFLLISAVVSLPLSYYEGFVRQHAYGLSTQTLARWASDWAKGTALGALGLALVIGIPFWLLRKSPRRWWLYTGLAAAPLATFLLIIAPVWIDPMFNHFGRMNDRQLEQRILALAARAGISGSRVYEVDKSKDTRTVNAYVTGLGSTKRIVLWDTILQKLDQDQISFAVGHEMGHFVLGHVPTAIVVITLVVTGSLYIVHLMADRLIVRFSNRFGFSSLSDVASFPLLLVLASVVSLLVSPALLAFSRHQEHEADRFGLELTRGNRAAASAFVRLQEENLAVPRPGWLYVFWRASHPPLGERVDFANQYRPWACGQPSKYGRLFR